MPIYEYVCEHCGTKYEKIVLSKAQEIACPNCESTKNKLQLSVFSARSGNGASGTQAKSRASFSGSACCGAGSCGCH